MKENMDKHKQEMEKIHTKYDEEISDLKENNEAFVTQLRSKQVFKSISICIISVK